MTTTKTTKQKVNRTTPETRAAIINMWLAGHRNGTAIGRAIGFTQATVFNVLENAGLYERKRMPQKAAKVPQNGYTKPQQPQQPKLTKQVEMVMQQPVEKPTITMIEPKKQGWFKRIWTFLFG